MNGPGQIETEAERFGFWIVCGLLVAAFVVAVSVLLVACGGDDDGEGGEGWTLEVVHVDVEGRDVTCVRFNNGRVGGLSCDWSARRDGSG